jgi:hypothetical protein
MKDYIRKKLLEGLLTEKKDNRRNIVDKLGLSQEVADWAHGISDKISLYIAKMLKQKHASEMKDIENKVPIEDYKEDFTQDFEAIADLAQKVPNKPPMNIKGLNYDTAIDLVNKFRYISDWLNHPESQALAEFGPGFLTKKTWDEAVSMSDEFHQGLTAGGNVEDLLDEKDEIFHTFSDGFSWVLRKSRKCSKGAQSMGHCGSASSSDMFLLRLVKGNKEFITVDWHPEEKYVKQLKGLKNKKPLEAYHPYIVWLLNASLTTPSGVPFNVDQVKTHQGYLPHTNFQLGDLNPKDSAKIIGERPSLQSLKYVLKYTNSEKKGQLISNLFKYDSFLSKLIPLGFGDFFNLVDKPNINKVIGIIVKDIDFLRKMNEYPNMLTDILIRFVDSISDNLRDKLIESLVSNEEIVKMLDTGGEDYLINNHSKPFFIEDKITSSYDSDDMPDDEYDDEENDIEYVDGYDEEPEESEGETEDEETEEQLPESYKRKLGIIKELRSKK